MKRTNPFIREGEKYQMTIVPYKQYELEYYVFERIPREPSIYIFNRETNTYNQGSDLFGYDIYEDEIRDDLLPTIDEVVERNWGDEVIGNNIISAIIEPQTTYFTSNNDLAEGIKEAKSNPAMQLTTEDFRAISAKWLDFLESKAI